MSVTATQASTQTGAAGTQNNELFESNVESQLNTFLNLLTAQIQNQDPLAPLESTQFVEQLATFSGLEQQVRGNEYLAQITTLMNDFFSVTASEWIGQTVEVESAYVPFDGNSVNYTADIPESVDEAFYAVRDSNGNTIYIEPLDLGADNWTWDGQNSNGETVPNDIYQTSIELYSGGEYTGSLAPRLITEVAQASLENGKIRLGLDNHLSEYADNVRKVK